MPHHSNVVVFFMKEYNTANIVLLWTNQMADILYISILLRIPLFLLETVHSAIMKMSSQTNNGCKGNLIFIYTKSC